MTIGFAITILPAVLDFLDKVNLTWWQILLPMFIEIGLYIVIWLLVIGGAITVETKAKREAKRNQRRRRKEMMRRR